MIKKSLQASLRWMEDENRRVILNLVEENRSAKILDCGCGNGEFTKSLAEKARAKELYGLELVNESVQLAEEKGIRIYRTSLNEKFPIDDEFFNVVISNQVIEHLYNTDLFIKEIWRILKWGGYAIISTPNLASWHSIVCLAFGFQPHTAFVSDEVRVGNIFILNPLVPPAGAQYPAQAHLRIFTWNSLKELFQYHGFKVERIVGVGYYPFVGNLAKFLSLVDGKHSANLIIKAQKLKNNNSVS